MSKKKQIYTTRRIILLSLAIVSTFYLISLSKPPEFFDQFGLIVFSFITGLGISSLHTNKELSDDYAFWLLTAGILGLITDGAIVFGFI